MKIAIPTVNGLLCPHFGHCQQFAIIEADRDTKSINSSEMQTPTPHEPGVLPAWLGEMGCNIIIAGGMGQRAVGMFQQNGIEVIVGAPCETPEKIVNAYLGGALQAGDNVCDH